MKSATGFFATLVGGLCCFLTGLACASTPISYATNGDVAPPPPAYGAEPYDSQYWDKCPPPAKFPADCFCYRWQIWANALFLTRSGVEDLPLAFGDPGDPKGSQIFGTGDLDFDFGWGPNVGVAYCLNECNSIGVEFYGIDGWSSTGQVAGNISVQFPSFPYLPTPVDPNDPNSGYGVATFNYTSNLFNTEINFRHRASNMSWLTMLAGFRWIELGEEFGTVFETGGATPNCLIDVNNHLYGFQIGALANIRNYGPWFFDGWLKAGIFGNAADQDTTEDFSSVGGTVLHYAAKDSNAAFAGDIGVSVGRRITDRLSARVGYMALWIEGVALAPEQLDDVALASLDNSGSAFYHGGFVGFEYLW